MKNLSITGIVLLASMTSQAQLAPFKFGDFRVSAGTMMLMDNKTPANSAYQNVFVSSPLFPASLSGYDRFTGGTVNGSGMLTLASSVYFRNKEKSAYNQNQFLRVGISYFGSSTFNTGYHKEDRFVYDTLYSARTGDAYLVDSVYRESFNMSNQSKNLVADIAWVCRTDHNKRWKFAAGLGVQLGFGFNRKAVLTHFSGSSIELASGEGLSSLPASFYSYQQEEVNLGPSFSGAIYVPMSVEFRLGSKEALRHSSLFYELRPSLYLESNSTFGNALLPALSQQIGMRMEFLN